MVIGVSVAVVALGLIAAVGVVIWKKKNSSGEGKRH